MIILSEAAQLFIPGSINETDAHATLFYLELNFPSSVRLFYKIGNGINGGSPPVGTFTPSTVALTIIVSLDLTTGAWTSSTGLSGIASADQLTDLQDDFLGAANDAEAFGVANDVILGEGNPWTSDVY